MRKLLSNRLYLMLASVLIAFVIWVSVMSISNPDTSGSKAVNVEERNADVLKAAGKAYTIQGSKTVKVNYSVQARDAYKVKSSDFRAYVDLSDIYESTGSVRVVVQTVNNQDIISECSCTPQTLQVIVEDIITKTVDVKVYTVDKCPDGYEAAASATTLTQVDITGPESLINSIAVAGVEVSVRDATSTLTGSAPLKFYDSDRADAMAVDVEGNQFFSASKKETDYTIFISTLKSVPIQYEISGIPATGYHYSGSSASIASVMVVGNADVVGQISAITIPSAVLNIDGATSNKTWNIDLKAYLPSGTSIEGTYQTEITAVVDADISSYSGPGVTAQAETTDTSGQTEAETGESSAQTSDGTQSEGPGAHTTQPETVDEKQAETQEETSAETSVGHSQAESHAQTHAESQSSQQDETQAESQAHSQDPSRTESQPHGQSEAQTGKQPGEQTETVSADAVPETSAQ